MKPVYVMNYRMFFAVILIAATVFSETVFSQQKTTKEGNVKMKEKTKGGMDMAPSQPIDTSLIERITGVKDRQA